MKIIQELVAHFDAKGRLSPKQIRNLLEEGFLAADAPVHMVDLADTIGAVFYFRVTGDENGMIWGTHVYAGDSALATAAVHAGAVKHNETAAIKVTIMTPLDHYVGSESNGVTSHDFGRFGSAYTVERV